MKRSFVLIGTAIALSSALAAAQDSPESLLPPGFERPARQPKGNPAPQPSAGQPDSVSNPVVQQVPGQTRSAGGSGATSTGSTRLPSGRPVPSLKELEAMSPEELDQLLGLRSGADIPAAARRSMRQIGILAFDEGGMPAGSFVNQDPALIRSILGKNQGRLVSRWGHILLRRALASRLSAPRQMSPADFVALRAALLVRMGEGEVARSLVQDVDAANFTPDLTQAALSSYVATADLTGICPAVHIQGGARKDSEWQVARAICASFSGSGSTAMTLLDRLSDQKAWPEIDLLLAQKYAGSAGKVRRAVTIEWDGVEGMNPWRYALTIATGLQPPSSLMEGANWRYETTAATAPMLPLQTRAAAADRAAAFGVLSSQAMVDLYGQIYAQQDITGEWRTRAEQLRDTYVDEGTQARIDAIQALWDDTTNPDRRYGRQVLTAYAAARLPAGSANGKRAADLIASMLAAGLDANALRWAAHADQGSEAWALLALAQPNRSTPVSSGAIDSYFDADDSEGARKTAFLVAGLAGLGRLEPEAIQEFSEKLEVDFSGQSNWIRAIEAAATANNAAMVSVLAGVGMQGDSWAKMTPRYLYHIVAALNRVGLSAEARMIAAEAVARG